MRKRFLLPAAAAAVLLTAPAPPAGGAPAPTPVPAADTPPSIVEDYSYPGAAEILAQRGLKLIKGDGHILLADCVTGAGQAEVWSRTKGHFCFRVTGSAGLLTMEVPEAYLLVGAGGHTIAAKVVVDGVTSSVAVGKGEFRGIGEGGDPDSGPATLLEFRATAA